MILRIVVYGMLLIHMATMPMGNDASESGLVIKKITGRVVPAQPEDFLSSQVKHIVCMSDKSAAQQALYPIAFGKTAQGDIVPVDPSAQYAYAHLVESQFPILAMRAISTAAQNGFFPAQIALVRQQPKSLMDLLVLENIVKGQTLSGGHQLYHLPSIKMYADLMRAEHPETAAWFDTLRNDLERQLAVSRPNAIPYPTIPQPDSTSMFDLVHPVSDSTTNPLQPSVDALSAVIQKIESSPSNSSTSSPVLVKKSSPKPNADDLVAAIAIIEQQSSAGRAQKDSPVVASQRIKVEVPAIKEQPNFSQSLALIASGNFDQSDDGRAQYRQAVITMFESDVHSCDRELLQKALDHLIPLATGDQQRADRLARLVYHVIPDDHRAPAILAQASDDQVCHMARTIIMSPQTSDAQVVTWASHLLARGQSFDHEVNARVERAAKNSACAQDAIKLLPRQTAPQRQTLIKLLTGSVAYDQELLSAAVSLWDGAADEQKKMLAQKMLACTDTGSVTIPTLAAVYAVRDDDQQCFAALETVLRDTQSLSADIQESLTILQQKKGILQRKDCRPVAKSVALAVCQTYNDARHDQKDFVQWLINQVLNTAVTDQDELATQQCLLKAYIKLGDTPLRIFEQCLRVLKRSDVVDTAVLMQIKGLVPQLSLDVIRHRTLDAVTVLGEQSRLTSDVTCKDLVLEVAESISDRYPLQETDLNHKQDAQVVSCINDQIYSIAQGTTKAPFYQAVTRANSTDPKKLADQIQDLETIKRFLYLENNTAKRSELTTNMALGLGALYYRQSVDPGVTIEQKNELQQKALNELLPYVTKLLQDHAGQEMRANALLAWAAVAHSAHAATKGEIIKKLGIPADQLYPMIIKALEAARPDLTPAVLPECEKALRDVCNNQQQIFPGMEAVAPGVVMPADSLTLVQAATKAKDAIHAAELYDQAIELLKEGDGVTPKFKQALAKLEMSVTLGHTQAARRLTTMYLEDPRLNNIPDSKNHAKGHLEWLINKGDQPSRLRLATVLEEEKNFKEAIAQHREILKTFHDPGMVHCKIGEAYIKWAESVEDAHLKKIYKDEAWKSLKQSDAPKAKIMRLKLAGDQGEITDQNSDALQEFFSVLGDVETGDVDFDYVEKILKNTTLVARIQQLKDNPEAHHVLGIYHMLRSQSQSKNPQDLVLAKNYYQQAVNLGKTEARHPLIAMNIQLAEYHKNYAEVAQELFMDMLAWYADGDCNSIVQNLGNCIRTFKASSDQAAHDQIDELAESISGMLGCIDSSNPNDAPDSLKKRMQLLVLRAELITYYREKKNVPTAQALCNDVAQDIVAWLQSDISQPWADAQYCNKVNKFFTLWQLVMQDADNALKIYDKLIPFKPEMKSIKSIRDKVFVSKDALWKLWNDVAQKDFSAKGLILVVLKNDKREITGYRLMQDRDQKK